MIIGCFCMGISMMLIAVLLSYKGTDKGTLMASVSVTFFFTVSTYKHAPSNFMLTHPQVYALLRRVPQRHSLVLQRRDPATEDSSTRCGNRHPRVLVQCEYNSNPDYRTRC